MANVEKEMRSRPAKWPLDTLDACIRDFQWRRAPGGGMDVKADDIPAMCAEAASVEDAVWIACASKRRNGKMHTHQTKVRVEARREFGFRIIEQVIPAGKLILCETFEEFYDILWDIHPAGIGPLTTYDVATRIGAYLGLAPVRLYLHTGARMGWDALWGGFQRYPNVVSVAPEMWPPGLRKLSADLAEDFLCTYRDSLTRIKRNHLGEPI